MKLFKDKRTRKNCRIYATLKESKKHLSFHTPGHKAGKWDVTELSYTDNLAAPKGCIAQAEREIAEILGAKRSFILTDGSTSGVLAMLYAAKARGVKAVAFPLQSHKSVWNGCALLGLTPLAYGENVQAEELGVGSNGEWAEDFLSQAESADALLVTSPDYYGRVAALEKLRAYCDETGKLLLIDGAHGGHLHFEKTLHGGRFADLWVDGVHKSLPALTQGAVVSARTEALGEYLRKGVDTFRTSSPSYPIMASVEYAVKYPRNERLERLARALMEEERILKTDDWTKLCARFGKYAFEAEKTLEKRGIYPEFCDGNILMFYLSPATRLQSFRKLKRVLKRLFQKYPYEEEHSVQRVRTPLVLRENAATEWIPLDEAEGRICGANCGLFPPCTPLILRGERIEKEKTALFKQANNVYGVLDGKICVITEEKRQ